MWFFGMCSFARTCWRTRSPKSAGGEVYARAPMHVTDRQTIASHSIPNVEEMLNPGKMAQRWQSFATKQRLGHQQGAPTPIPNIP